MVKEKLSAKQFLTLFFPAVCLHCGEDVEAKILFCPTCQYHFSLLTKAGRCSSCFSEGKSPCEGCRGQIAIFRNAYCFSPSLPAQTYVQALLGGRMPYLSKSGAAFLFLMFTKLEWKIDLIVPMPSRGLLMKQVAKELASLIDKPCSFPLKGDYKLKRWISPDFLSNKRILLVDFASRRDELKKAAEALHEELPAKVFALSLIELTPLERSP